MFNYCCHKTNAKVLSHICNINVVYKCRFILIYNLYRDC